MTDEDLIEKAKLLLGPIGRTQLSGASIEFLEGVLNPPPKYGIQRLQGDPSTLSPQQRSRIRELCILHQI